jgi:hypothetical protein
MLGGERDLAVIQDNPSGCSSKLMLNGLMGRYSLVLKSVMVGSIILSVGRPVGVLMDELGGTLTKNIGFWAVPGSLMRWGSTAIRFRSRIDSSMVMEILGKKTWF